MNFFSQKLIETIKKSAQICQREKSAEIAPRHLLSALEQTKGGLAFDILAQVKPLIKKRAESSTRSANSGANLGQTASTPDFEKQDTPKVFANAALSKEAKEILQRAGSIAHKNQHQYIGTEHLLAAFFTSSNEKSNPSNLPVEKIKKYLETVLKSSSHLPNFSKIFQLNLEKMRGAGPGLDAPPSALECFAADLTDPAYQKNVNPVIGREKEIERMIQILCRKDKNNPLILGEAGVGKTALVEGLAKKISAAEVPLILLDKKILCLDMGLIVAGTIYRGEFENRLKAIMDEVERDPNIILFIDELHNIIGAGSAHGSLDAANMLKPLLARGKLRCIGATTPQEYKKHIETDPALERRFQPIYLCEPGTDETLKILQGVKENYQTFHQVAFADDALTTAVELSNRYIQDKLQPDKAIDLIDEAAAKVKIKEQAQDEALRELHKLEEQLKSLKLEKEKAVAEENFNHALKIKEKEKRLALQIKSKSDEREKQKAKFPAAVSKKDILNLISQKTGIPILELEKSEYEQLNRIKEEVQRIIIGQNQQIDEIVQTISYAKLGLSDENRPLASFLFLGPSGVGKTFTGQKLAEFLFSDKEAFIHVDMSEFNEKFQISKLIGAPAGYVGYREGNKFTDLVKKHPYCLILLDEIEKAHPDVLDLLLQILEYGHLTDAVGKKINFKNAIIIMTSNIFSERFSGSKMGFGEESVAEETRETILPELKKQFKPEFVNRLDNIIIFNKLTNSALELIAEQSVAGLTEKSLAKGIELKISPEVVNFLAALAAEQNAGARGVKNVLKQRIEQPLVEKIMSGQTKCFKVLFANNDILIQ
ncbi:ATP-dependent Clp protease ATP-binding subunit [Candidatus Falkowbacteria bacterium]|nr:ATP-dependent Clp protease ATP-binding subunit [Candidatus Falkowbacteria bacterium]